MKKLAIITGVLLTLSNVSAQDIHFSQFWNAEQYNNPGAVGMGRSNARTTLQLKEQWSSINKAYRTGMFSFDMPVLKSNSAQLGVGVYAFSDKIADGAMFQNKVGLNVGGAIEVARNHKISLGISTAYMQNGIDPSGFQWSSQFDGTGYNSGIGGENVAAQSLGLLDFATGVYYSIGSSGSSVNQDDDFKLDVGFSVSHLTRPNISLAGQTDQLERKYLFQAQSEIAIPGNNISLVPMGFFQLQGAHTDIVFGGLVKYALQSGSKVTGFKKGNGLYVGSMFRLNDAIIPTLGFYISDFAINVSYDFNLSNLAVYTTGRGGFELTLRYEDFSGALFGRKIGKASLR
jgi:type IX secretion system PorP/SprF family membrane protein